MLAGYSTIGRGVALLLFVWQLGSGTATAADEPSLVFDFARTIACRDITPETFSQTNPGEKMIEVPLRISVQLLAGSIADVDEVRIEAKDCDRRMRVHSFSPETRLESQFSDGIHVTKTSESNKSLGAALGGEAPVLLGDVVAHVTPSINGGVSKRDAVTERFERVSPKQVVVTAGTIENEHGVFFKLRSSTQSSLEGVHELVVQFIVPSNWRGDALRVCCSATGKQRFLWYKQPTTWTHKCRPAALYLNGDLEARKAAERHVEETTRS